MLLVYRHFFRWHRRYVCCAIWLLSTKKQIGSGSLSSILDLLQNSGVTTLFSLVLVVWYFNGVPTLSALNLLLEHLVSMERQLDSSVG